MARGKGRDAGPIVKQARAALRSLSGARAPVVALRPTDPCDTAAAARLLGRYDSKVSFGQSRVLVVWTDIILPNGSTLQIGGMAGTDAQGYGGFSDNPTYAQAREIGQDVVARYLSGEFDRVELVYTRFVSAGTGTLAGLPASDGSLAAAAALELDLG